MDQQPKDGVMDDLNGDGRLDLGDARWLFDLVDGLSRSGSLDGLIGGLGLYSANAVHGPFIHLDVRGQRARW